LDYWENQKHSVSGFSGNCIAEYFPIDVDNEDLSISLKTCHDIIGKFETNYEIPLKSLNIYFSGSKGFHIEVPTILFGDISPAKDLPYRFKKIAMKFGFSNIDLSIYKSNALWRIPNTINSKSSLYKIPLSISQLRELSIDQIKEHASTPQPEINNTSPYDWFPRNHLSRLWNESEYVITTNSNISIKSSIRGVKEGDRNNEAFKIAQDLKRQGIGIDEAKHIIEKWNQKNKPPEKNLVSLYRTVESAYKYNFHDSGSIGITKHLRNDSFYNSLNHPQQSIYIYIISHLNEVLKFAWGKYPCGPNQLIYSNRTLADNTKTSPQIVKTLINILKNIGRIDVEILVGPNGRRKCSRLTFNNCIVNPPANPQFVDGIPSTTNPLNNFY